jgi:DNA-binding FadR family transcriptional regulator
MVGSEAELMARFAASRGVIREAVTLVESHMLAETRRGVGGGLVVAEPAPSVVEGIVSLYLARKHATGLELLETRIALEVMAMRQVLERLDGHGVEALRAEMARPLSRNENLTAASHRFHNLLADLSGNTVLQLFIPTMSALVGEMWEVPRRGLKAAQRADLWSQTSSVHAEIIQSMLRGDGPEAVRLLEQHLTVVASSLSQTARLQVASSLA